VVIDENIQKLNSIIDEKKNFIINSQESIEKNQEEQNSIQKDIDTLVSQKENFWETTSTIQKQIEDKNKELEEVMDRLRALENVMRIINTIEDIKNENIEAKDNIEACLNQTEGLNSQVNEIQIKVDQAQKVIDSFRNEKTKELESQKTAQKELNKINKDLQKQQKKLNELNKNKEREQKIEELNQEILDTEKQIESVLKELEILKDDLSTENEKKDVKQDEIDKLAIEKDESWKKQKQHQKMITDLKSDQSMENSKKNNFESKKIICADQIETLFQRSKDFGSLPPVSETLSEGDLQSDIVEASNKKKALEPVNLKAIEQYDTVKERL
jgi:chromosome segregation protein